MIRSACIAIAAAATLGLTTVLPTSAEAGHRYRHHHRHGHAWVAPAIVAGALFTGAMIAAESRRCYRRAWIDTAYGPRQVWVNVC